MGIQSTITLTREECISRVTHLLLTSAEEEVRKRLLNLSDRQLEELLESLHDSKFDNFLISEK